MALLRKPSASVLSVCVACESPVPFFMLNVFVSVCVPFRMVAVMTFSAPAPDAVVVCSRSMPEPMLAFASANVVFPTPSSSVYASISVLSVNDTPLSSVISFTSSSSAIVPFLL